MTLAELYVLCAPGMRVVAWQSTGCRDTAEDVVQDVFVRIISRFDAVDQTDAYASGCSIDGLFRALRGLEARLGAGLVGGGRVHFRDETGAIRTVTRDEFSRLGESGVVNRRTRVFDPTVATAGEWRARFETDAADSWHAAVLPA